MNQPELLERARAGDSVAIAALINHSLEPKGITARTALQDGCLEVMLESDSVPDQARLSAFIHRGIVSLKSPIITNLSLSCQQSGQCDPAWTVAFTLEAGPPSAASSVDSPAPAPTPTPEASSSPLSLKERARQGDAEALATLFNRALEGKGVTLKLAVQDSCLRVELESQRVPDDGLVNVLIHRELSNLRSPLIKTVQISGRDLDEPAPAWTQELVAKPIGDGSLYIQYVIPGQEEDGPVSSGSMRAPGKAAAKKSGQSGKRERIVSNAGGTSLPPARPAANQRDKILERKLLSCACHLSVFPIFGWFAILLPLGVWLLVPDPVSKDNAKEVLNFCITLIVYMLSAGVLALLIPGVGFIVVLLILAYSAVMPILAAVQCWNNPEQAFRYPMISRPLN